MNFKSLIRIAQVSIFTACLFSLGVSPAHSQEAKTSVYSLQESSPSLIAHKIASHLSTDTAKVTAIYDWITANIDYDAARLRTGNLSAQSSIKTLTSRRGLCLDFATLFNEMALSVGVKSEVVVGRTPSKDQSPSSVNHAWNRVLIGNEFKVVDTTWGSGTVNIKDWSFKREKNSRFLLADPESLRFTHWQADSTGKLIAENGLTLEVFNQTHPNTLQLLNLGFQAKDLLTVLSKVGENQLPRVYMPLDAKIRVIQAPLRLESNTPASRIEFQHSEGTTLLLLIGNEYQPLISKNATESVAIVNSNTGGDWSICYRLPDGSPYILMSYSGSI